MLLGSRYPGGIDDLPGPGLQAMGSDLPIQLGEKRLHSGHTQTVLEVPDRGAVGDVERVFQAAEALEAASIEQLKLRLFIRQAMQPLDHQDPHHDLGRIGRPPTLGLLRTRGYPFHRLRQGGEIDNGLNLPKGITQGIHLFCPPIPGKEIVLDGCPVCDPLSISPTI